MFSNILDLVLLVGGLGQLKGRHGLLSIMTVRDQRHTNVSKQIALLVDVEDTLL